MARVPISIDQFPDYAGREIGVSEPMTVSQEAVDMFGTATRDTQWIHQAGPRAEQGPYGRPIAHGLFLLSMAPYLLRQVVELRGVSMGVNYGYNRVRFPDVMPIGEQLRLRLACLDAVPFTGGVQVTFRYTMERPGSEKPVCVAEGISRFLAER